MPGQRKHPSITKERQMSRAIDEAVTQLTGKMKPGALPGVVKFVMTGEGAIMLDASGVRAADEEADVTLTAEAPVFQAMLQGDLSPMNAFMSGKLKVEGEMALAMKLGSVLG
jgi:putative sterol carrier protein